MGRRAAGDSRRRRASPRPKRTPASSRSTATRTFSRSEVERAADARSSCSINYANAASLVEHDVRRCSRRTARRPASRRLRRADGSPAAEHAGCRDVHRARRRRRRHVDQHAPRHRGRVAVAGPDAATSRSSTSARRRWRCSAKIISVNRTSIEQLGVSYDLASPAAFFNTLVPRTRTPAAPRRTDTSSRR